MRFVFRDYVPTFLLRGSDLLQRSRPPMFSTFFSSELDFKLTRGLQSRLHKVIISSSACATNVVWRSLVYTDDFLTDVLYQLLGFNNFAPLGRKSRSGNELCSRRHRWKEEDD